MLSVSQDYKKDKFQLICELSNENNKSCKIHCYFFYTFSVIASYWYMRFFEASIKLQTN